MAIPSSRLAAALALAVLGAGPAPSRPAAPAPSLPASAARTPVLTVDASDFSYRAPATVAAGPVLIRLVNRGRLTHHVVVTRLGDTTSLGTFYRAITTPDLAATAATCADVGGPAMAAPGHSAEAEVVLEPGRYALSCWVTGA